MEDRYLFRAKRVDNGEWVKGYFVQTVESSYIVVPYKHSTICGEGSVIEIDKSTICQCAGLKDDNDTLIFENDVLSLADKVSDYEWKAVVKFGNPDSNDTWGWRLVPITECYVNREILLWVKTELNTVECRVIGNIFDNKDLLESEEK